MRILPPPGAWCVRDAPGITLLLHAAGDFIIFIAYMTIAALLLGFIWDRPHYRHPFVYLFGVFVGLCGLTHFANIWTLYVAPDFTAQGYLLIATAAASVLAAAITPASLSHFSTKMHDTASNLQRVILEKNELMTEIQEMKSDIAYRDARNQSRQEKMIGVLEQLVHGQGVALGEMRSAAELARAASEKILSRHEGERHGQG